METFGLPDVERQQRELNAATQVEVASLANSQHDRKWRILALVVISIGYAIGVGGVLIGVEGAALIGCVIALVIATAVAAGLAYWQGIPGSSPRILQLTLPHRNRASASRDDWGTIPKD